MESLRLHHGDGYGSRFFSSQSREWLQKTIMRFPNIASFDELRSKATPEFFKNEAEMDRCREAISVVQQVADVAALNRRPSPGGSDQPLKDAIFMPDVVADAQVAYFSLPAIGETSTVKEIANLVLYALLTAVKNHKEKGSKQQTYLVIDEVQQMASEAMMATSVGCAPHMLGRNKEGELRVLCLQVGGREERKRITPRGRSGRLAMLVVGEVQRCGICGRRLANRRKLLAPTQVH